MEKKAIVWFRNDLRLHDNESLNEALASADTIFPVYVFDDRVFKGNTKFGFRKTGIHRARFIIEAITNLRKNIQSLGSELIVRTGITEEVIMSLAREIKTSWVFCNRERTQEEVDIQDSLEKNLWSIGQEVRYNRGKMLYYTADLPFPVNHTPDIFTNFRKEVEKIVDIREPLAKPDHIKPFSLEIKSGDIPTLRDFGFSQKEIDGQKECKFKGGETAGINQLNHFIWKTESIRNYKETRNELLGWDYSSKFSPYLAQGCLSPKLIYKEIKKYEEQRIKNESTYWMFFELLWRDFFRLMGKKHGNKIFQISGPKEEYRDWDNNWDLFNAWANARTGIPFIDANMKELNETGFMSNRGRQNVASFLINDLQVNWLMGAEYFESLLIDYDPCSNYGNWNYLAGVGSDPRENRYFNIQFQASKYDSSGTYVKHMLPVLRNIEENYIHQPEEMTIEDQMAVGCIIGENYPEPIINWSKSN